MMYKIKFKYADALSNWEWHNQECQLSAMNETDAMSKCKKLYGLGADCVYKILEILSIEEV